MKIKNIYLILAAIGIVAPYSVFAPYFLENGFVVSEFLSLAFRDATASFLSLDLLAMVLVTLVFIFVESKRLKIKKIWLPIILIFFVNLAFGFPIFLYMREKAIESGK